MNPIESIARARKMSSEGMLLDQWGSRSLPWRIYLGLLDADVPESEDLGSISAADNLRLKI